MYRRRPDGKPGHVQLGLEWRVVSGKAAVTGYGVGPWQLWPKCSGRSCAAGRCAGGGSAAGPQGCRRQPGADLWRGQSDIGPSCRAGPDWWRRFSADPDVGGLRGASLSSCKSTLILIGALRRRPIWCWWKWRRCHQPDCPDRHHRSKRNGLRQNLQSRPLATD